MRWELRSRRLRALTGRSVFEGYNFSLERYARFGSDASTARVMLKRSSFAATRTLAPGCGLGIHPSDEGANSGAGHCGYMPFPSDPLPDSSAALLSTRFGMENGENTDVPATGGPAPDEEAPERST